MERRDVIRSLGLISMHALYPSVLSGFLASCASGEEKERKLSFFDTNDGAMIAEVIDLILPKTATQSASEAGVLNFLDEVFALCLLNKQMLVIKEGLAKFKTEWLQASDKLALVKLTDAKAYSGIEEFAWFKTLKQYTLIGFFTGKEGTLKAGDYQKDPGRFIGVTKAEANTLAHSKTFLKYYF